MNIRNLTALAATLALSLPAASFASSVFYNSESAFDAAVGSTPLTVESFEGAPTTSTATALTFGSGITFSCSGPSYCPGFFGQSTLLSTQGSTSVYGATPDALTFSFATPVNYFAVDLLDAGTVGATDVTMTLSNGSHQVVLTNHSGGQGNVEFLAASDAGGFTSITFTGTAPDDGLYFDRAQFASAVPEPATTALMLAGLGLLGLAKRRQRRG